MMNLMNTAYTTNLSAILADDVSTPELRNPKLSGMSKTRRNVISRLIRGLKSGL